MNGSNATLSQKTEKYGPLSGVKVLDWTMWQFGPVAASMLGDMGADVIKLEALDGDVGRAVSSIESADAGMPNGRNAYFETCNRNKRGIAVNLKTAEGREIVHKLVAEADVVIENFRNGVAERLSMDYDTLKADQPQADIRIRVGVRDEGSGRADALPGCVRTGAGRPDDVGDPTVGEASYIGQGSTIRPDWRHHPVPRDTIGAVGEGKSGSRAESRSVAHEQHDVAAGACHRYGLAHR